jgi:phage-related protein
MATFPNYQPVYSATKRSRPVVRTARFGDGYEQRLTFGLNQNPKEWSVRFDLADEDADIVESFLDARAADNESFSWTPPETSTAYKWVCEEWTRELYDFKRSRIDLTLRQVFEP